MGYTEIQCIVIDVDKDKEKVGFSLNSKKSMIPFGVKSYISLTISSSFSSATLPVPNVLIFIDTGSSNTRQFVSRY